MVRRTGPVDTRVWLGQGKLKEATREQANLKEMTRSLLLNQDDLRQREKAALDEASANATKVAELEEQMRDLMFYLEARDKIESSAEGEELRDGSIGIVEEAKRTQRKGKGRKS